jgi:hypothetical protein
MPSATAVPAKKRTGNGGTKLLAWLILIPLIFFVNFVSVFFWFVGLMSAIPYFVKKAGLNGMPAAVLRGVVLGTAVPLAVVAPIRTVAIGLLWPWYGFEGATEILAKFSLYGQFVAPAAQSAGLSDTSLAIVMGVSGVVVTALAGLVVWGRSLRVAGQMANLPTATVRSAALGLSEFKGKAIALGGMPGARILYQESTPGRKQGEWTVKRSRFYLEDETGRILVDTDGAEFASSSGNGREDATMYFSVRTIVLENRHQAGNGRETWELCSGDDIYLVGTVEANPDAAPTATDAERLIVRPSSRKQRPNLVETILFGDNTEIGGSDMHDVFLLTDQTEADARKMAIKGARQLWGTLLFWVAASVTLVLLYLPG